MVDFRPALRRPVVSLAAGLCLRSCPRRLIISALIAARHSLEPFEGKLANDLRSNANPILKAPRIKRFKLAFRERGVDSCHLTSFPEHYNALRYKCNAARVRDARQALFAPKMQCIYVEPKAVGDDVAKAVSKATKSETLTIRLDPKMRFALEFVARLRGQTITTVVERAIRQAADTATTPHDRSWEAFWDVSEGMRAIRLAVDNETHPSFDDDEMLDFVVTHWPFFADDVELKRLRRESIDILWPSIGEFLALWRETKVTDRTMVPKRMQEALHAAGAGFVPAWPQSKKSLLTKGMPPEEDSPF